MNPNPTTPATAPQLSIQLLNFSQDDSDWRQLIDLARLADERGIDRLVVSDHVLMGERLDAYADPGTGGMAGAVQPTDPDGHWLDPLVLLSVLAPITERIRLGTAILIAALRPAPVLAKTIATLDVLSGGRVDLGVGVGWQREEYEASGLAFEGRGRRLDDTLEICRKLWTEQVVDHDDGVHRLERIHAMPKPRQSGGVPIWVSGRATDLTARRLARFGHGWLPWGDDMTDPRPGIERLRRALSDAGRDPAELQAQGSLPVVLTDAGIDLEATLAPVAELVDAGVTDFRVRAALGRDPEADDRLLTELVPAFRRHVGRTD